MIHVARDPQGWWHYRDVFGDVRRLWARHGTGHALATKWFPHAWRRVVVVTWAEFNA